MKRLFAFVICISVAMCAHGGAIADNFGSGFSGIAWGASLDTVVGVFPNGDHVFSTTPGQRAYSVKDDQEIFGVPRQGHSILYGFGEQDEVVVVAASFPYERRDQLLGTLIATFGADAQQSARGQQVRYDWHSDAGVAVSVVASKKPKHGIVWLCIYSPRYGKASQPSDGSSSANKTAEPTR
jgi:hypothetical protein